MGPGQILHPGRVFRCLSLIWGAAGTPLPCCPLVFAGRPWCARPSRSGHVWVCGVVGDPLSVPCCLGVRPWVTGALLSLVSQNRAFISGRVAVSLKAMRLARVQARSRINGLHVPARYWPPIVLICLCAAVICREMCVLGTGSAPSRAEGGRTMAHGLRGPFAGWTVASSRLVCEL